MADDVARRAHAVLKQVVNVPPSERNAALDRLCANDDEVRAEVVNMLAALDEADEFLETPALGIYHPAASSRATPITLDIPGYRIIEQIGAGGMATVYEAIQEHPRRVVALKILKHGLVDSSAAQRFAFETESLARLRHPGLAQLYEVGSFDAALPGQGSIPFFAMEFTDGARPITTYAKAVGLSVVERVRMIADVCDAVQHAHVRGIIHRDLKPANILVDADGRPRVIDFGIARSTDPEHDRLTRYTDSGSLIGTLTYMSPEQCAGAGDIDHQTDVYSLGVVLYEMLCGTTPHDNASKPVAESLRMIQEDEPKRPSSVNPDVRGDLETIILAAIEKSPSRRYASAAALGADLRHYLAHEPIEARPATRIYKVRKFAERHRTLVIFGCAAVLSLVGGLTATAQQAYRATQAKDDARRAEGEERRLRIDAEKREKDLEQVVQFHAAQLSGISPEMMGVRMKDSIIAAHQRISTALPDDDSTPSAQTATIEATLAGIPFADIARETLDQTIFDRALDAISTSFADDPALQARLLQTIADTARGLGLLDTAYDAQTTALQQREDVLGPEHVDTLVSRKQMARVYIALARTDDAVPLLQSAREGLVRVLGPDDPLSISALADIGDLRRAQGRQSEAEAIYRDVLTAYQQTIGPDAIDTIISQVELGDMLVQLGRTDEGLPLMQSALERFEKTDRSDTIEMLQTTLLYGHGLHQVGRLEEAEASYRRSSEGFRQRLGDDHPETQNALHSIGAVLRSQGRFEEAEPFYRRSLDASRRVFGDDHPETIFAAAALGILLDKLGRYEEAEPYYRAAVEGRRRALGENHRMTIIAMANLSGFLYDRERLEESEAIGRDAVHRARQYIEPDHWHIAVVIEKLGRTLTPLDQFEESERLLLESYSIFAATLGEQHSRAVANAGNLVRLYRRWHEAQTTAGHDDSAARWQTSADTPED